ncbi:MAG: hypothetical protein HKN23_09585 [Verrucomicrobiales bacterium]|nr:hypothetical protein [Verrucomicrobiales bacterium]
MRFLRQIFRQLDRTAIIWTAVLAGILGFQFWQMESIGDKGRDAVERRIGLALEQFETEGTTFEDEFDRRKTIYQTIRFREFISSGLWYGAAVGAVVVGLLILTIPWWCRPVSSQIETSAPPSFRRTLLWVTVIAVVALCIRLPRMDLSLYNDESFNFTRYIHGQFKPDKETGEPVFRKHTWQQTVWGDHFANNGELYSILARLCHDSWQKSTGAADGEVNEAALRIPPLVGGLLSIFGIALAGLLFLGHRGAILAALLACLHPWHIRYSTEARAYGLVLLFAIAILLLLYFGIREKRWRWWGLLIFAEVFCLSSYIASLYFLIAANLIALGWILARHRSAFPRWLVTNLIAAVAFLHLAAPAIPQIWMATASSTTLQGTTSLSEIAKFTSYLVSGMPVVGEIPENPWAPSWDRLGVVVGWLGFFVGFAGVVFGLVKLFRPKLNQGGAFAASVTVLALLIAVTASNLSTSVLHHWYVIYALPGVIFLMAAGIEFLLRKTSNLRITGWVLLGFYLLSFAFPAIAYLHQTKEPLRPLMEHVRGDVYPYEIDDSTPILAAFWSDIVYDPFIIHTPTLPDLENAIARAESENRPLFVEFGYRTLAEQHNGEVVDFIENSGKFEFLKTFYGLEQSQFSHHLYKLKKTNQ